MDSHFVHARGCERSQLIEYATQVLAGQLKMAAVFSYEYFLLPGDVPDSFPREDEEEDQWRDAMTPVRSGKWSDFDIKKGRNIIDQHASAEDNLIGDRAQLIDALKFEDWIITNDLKVELGVHELADELARSLAADVINDLSIGWFSESKMLRILRNGNPMPVAKIAKKHEVYDGGQKFIWAELVTEALLGFLVPLNQFTAALANTEEIPHETQISDYAQIILANQLRSLSHLGDQLEKTRKQVDPAGLQGGDRLTKKLYDFANEVGLENVFPEPFRDWLKDNHVPDFDVSHGTISYRHANGEFAEVTSENLRGRIYRMRMKHSPKVR